MKSSYVVGLLRVRKMQLKKNWKANLAWRFMLVIPVLGKLRPELETSLGYNGFLLVLSLLVLICHLLG